MSRQDDGLRLLGNAELAALLGVSRQRVTQLAGKPWFPRPVAVLAMGAVWRLEDIEAMAADTGRALYPEAVWPAAGTGPAADGPGRAGAGAGGQN